MIILVLLLMGVSLVVFLASNRQREALWLTGVFLGFVLINVGLLIHYSKMGGLTYNEQILFFLTPAVQERLQRTVITLDSVARVFAVGRYSFVYSVLLFSLDLVGALRRRRWLAAAALAWPLASLVLTDPYCFLRQGYDGRWLANAAAELCVAVYLVISLVLLVKEYRNRKIGWVKKQLRYIILFILDLIVYFVFFGRVNPVSLYYSESFDSFFAGLPMYRLRFSLGAWALVILVFLFFIVVGLGALFRYARVNLAETRDEVSLERQLNTANMGTRVFIHGIKNQLFAEKILLGQMDAQLEAGAADAEGLRKNLAELRRINEAMNSRMEALYKVFRQNSMTLVPCRLERIVDDALEKAQKRLSGVSCEVRDRSGVEILADADYLSEALYNILVNAADAIKASPRAARGLIVVTFKDDHNWCAVRVDDNGTGIEKAKYKRIFEPFYTEKNTNYSWGIGLSYVRQIVKYHFGKLWVESVPGEGATFILAFPKYNPPKGR